MPTERTAIWFPLGTSRMFSSVPANYVSCPPQLLNNSYCSLLSGFLSCTFPCNLNFSMWTFLSPSEGRIYDFIWTPRILQQHYFIFFLFFYKICLYDSFSEFFSSAKYIPGDIQQYIWSSQWDLKRILQIALGSFDTKILEIQA